MNNKTFKDEIEAAERKLLIVSWVGIVVSVALIAFSIWGI
jgi:hypothetical protein